MAQVTCTSEAILFHIRVMRVLFVCTVRSLNIEVTG